VIHKDLNLALNGPNFRCSITSGTNKGDKWLTYAESKETLVKRLIESGHKHFRIETYDFNDWLTKAMAAKQKAIAEYPKNTTKFEFDETIWKEVKRYLFDLFDGKCAYCESKVLHVYYGEVEHYRPKRKVSEDRAHSGYYWQAYELLNLLPVCQQCNTARGKKTHFPVRGARAKSCNDDLRRENRLLLMPYLDNPREELIFLPGKDGFYSGVVKGKSERGKKSVKIYNLNREPLLGMRRDAQEMSEFKILALQDGIFKDKREHYEREVKDGKVQFSSAVLSQLEYWVENQQNKRNS
jgi:hypothetical protein